MGTRQGGEGEFSIVKLKGEETVADGLAEHMDRQKMEQYMESCSMVRRSGRHELCPRLGDVSAGGQCLSEVLL